MGCTASKRVNNATDGSVRSNKPNHLPPLKTSGVQDDARSFRSKVGAIKMLSRSEDSYNAFLKFLETDGFSPFLICFRDMEAIKQLAEDQMISRTAALIWRYKVVYENVKVLGQKTEGNEHLIWECLGKLRQIDIANAPASLIMKHLIIAENEILARLVRPFESFLHSPQYNAWQELLLEKEKNRERQSRVHRSETRNNSLRSVSGASPTASGPAGAFTNHLTPATSMANVNVGIAGSPLPGNLSHLLPPSTMSSAENSLRSNPANPSTRLVTCSDSYPDILIVDDSMVALKLTGLTLEKDGHHVDKAHNGQVALQLMKSRPYDVVLIDINMPVMDGIETVRLFREFERNNNHLILPSDMSSISSSEGDFSRKDVTNNSVPTEGGGGGLSSSAAQGQTQSSPALASLDLNYRKPSLTAAHYHQLIIGISNNVDEETRVKALEAGMDYFLPKPFSLQKFVETIRMSRLNNARQANGAEVSIPSAPSSTAAPSTIASVGTHATRAVGQDGPAGSHPPQEEALVVRFGQEAEDKGGGDRS